MKYLHQSEKAVGEQPNIAKTEIDPVHQRFNSISHLEPEQVDPRVCPSTPSPQMPGMDPEFGKGKAASELPSSMTEQELDRLLKHEESAFSKELEVERILKAFKLNPYDLLDIDYTATPGDIKRRYRQLSLFIHPDKTPHPRAPDAFDQLKKAESDLSTPEKRDELDAVISAARVHVLKLHSLPPSITDPDDERIVDKGLKPGFREQVRARTREMLIEEELRRRRAVKMNLANEGLEAKKKEEEAAKKKRKAEDEVKWEENRDVRVDSWRAFQQGPKKKKKKANVLG